MKFEVYCDEANPDVLTSGSLKANFVTCYQADNSIGKIRSSPAWFRAACLRLLGGGP
jgi:uncharacterized membrane protein YhdT